MPPLDAATSFRASGETDGAAESGARLLSTLLDGVELALGVGCLPPWPALVGEPDGLAGRLVDGVALTVGAVGVEPGRTVGEADWDDEPWLVPPL